MNITKEVNQILEDSQLFINSILSSRKVIRICKSKGIEPSVDIVISDGSTYQYDTYMWVDAISQRITATRLFTNLPKSHREAIILHEIGHILSVERFCFLGYTRNDIAHPSPEAYADDFVVYMGRRDDFIAALKTIGLCIREEKIKSQLNSRINRLKKSQHN
jgi:hypothetical protein